MKMKELLNAGTARSLLPAIIIAAVMVLTAAALIAPAEETEGAPINVNYMDMLGVSTPALAEELTAAGDFGGGPLNYTLPNASGASWYVVTGSFSLGAGSTLTISGLPTVNLIIAGGRVLEVPQGITVQSGTTFNLFTADPGAGSIGELRVTGADGVTLISNYTNPFTNTAYINASGNGVYYSGATSHNISNGKTGIIASTGSDGINTAGGTVNNYGYIEGSNNGIATTGANSYLDVYNYDTGEIYGNNGNGISFAYQGRVFNSYLIEGDSYGVYSADNLDIFNYDTGFIIGQSIGICSDENMYVENEGIIEGTTDGGIYIEYTCNITNWGAGAAINGGTIGINTGDGEIKNSAAIYGDAYGIYFYQGGELYNDGTVTGGTCGIECWGDTYILNYEAGSIVALAGGEWAIRTDFNGCLSLLNDGLINGPGGILAELRGGWEIRNSETGAIEGTAGNAIEVFAGDSLEIHNDGGRIWGSNSGIVLYRPGNIYNNITATITGTILASGGDGIYLDAGGMVYNEGEIAGIRVGASGIDLKQWGLISGSVILTDFTNRVLLGSESVISGSLNMGSDSGSVLTFEGTPTGMPYTYATVGGTADIGAASVELHDIPGGFTTGLIVLIDANTGSVTGTPRFPTYTTVAPDPVLTFSITVEPIRLIAEIVAGGGASHEYYITASSDSRTTISPSGVVTVNNGDSVRFDFSASAGYFVGAVVVNGVYQPQAVIDAGFYVFEDVKANHTINVVGRTPTSGITLKINIVAGKGYAEYSVNGGPFAKYTSPVALIEGASLKVRAVADSGYEFSQWTEGSNVITLNEVTYTSRSATLELNLSFISDGSADGSSLGGSNLWLIIVVIIVVLLVLFLLIYLFRKKGKDEDGATKG